MRHNSDNSAIPIHNNINRRGTLRRLERCKNRKSTADSNTENLVLAFHNNTCDSFHDYYKNQANERLSITTAMRVRNLKKKSSLSQKKDIF